MSKGRIAATHVWEVLYEEIRQRGIAENYETLNESSDDDEDVTSEEITKSDNPFVKHFTLIKARVVKHLVKDEDEEITNLFYNPDAWKKFMSNWIPKIALWTALALGDLGRHGTS